jgi:hypothetical protein
MNNVVYSFLGADAAASICKPISGLIAAQSNRCLMSSAVLFSNVTPTLDLSFAVQSPSSTLDEGSPFLHEFIAAKSEPSIDRSEPIKIPHQLLVSLIALISTSYNDNRIEASKSN